MCALACAGSPKPAPVVDPPTGATVDAGMPDPASVATAAAPDAGAATATNAAAATAATPAPPPPPEPEDKCAPVAIAYEKSLRAKLRQCWLDGANKSKDRIIGSIKLIIEIDNNGKIVTQRVAEKSELPDAMQKCMIKAMKAEPIDGKKCDMKTFTIAEKFPR